MKSKLKALRESLSLSTTKLSYMLGVNQSTVLRYEKSEAERAISLASLERYAEVLGYELEYKFIKKKVTSKNSEYKLAKGSKNRLGYLPRSRSPLSDQMKAEELLSIRNLDPVSKLKKAYDLSIFLRKLKAC